MSDALPRIHPTALIESGVEIGPGTTVWDHVHIRSGANIGAHCIIGEKTYIAGGVVIGNLCKINAVVYLCLGVTLEDGVMVAAHTVFTNDRFPRATDPEVQELRTSDATEETLTTRVCRGATIGAGAIIGPGIKLGAWCMVGMGSVVTHDVPAHALVFGNPARVRGIMCRCGQVAHMFGDSVVAPPGLRCPRCQRAVPWTP